MKLFFPTVHAPAPTIPFTPTLLPYLNFVMFVEGKYKKYVFVINNAKVKKNGKIIFRVSSKYIDPNNINKTIKNSKKILPASFIMHCLILMMFIRLAIAFLAYNRSRTVLMVGLNDD